MGLTDNSTAVHDPVEQLSNVLTRTWNLLCCTYDASSALPGINTLFNGNKLPGTYQVAQDVLVNMLLEVIENIGRYSPWYTRPARSFGLLELRRPSTISGTAAQDFFESGTPSQNWVLAPEAIMRWQPQLADLANVIEATYPFIQAMLLVNGLMDQVAPGDAWISARCRCRPPREIQVTQLILERGEIRCDECFHPFRVVAG